MDDGVDVHPDENLAIADNDAKFLGKQGCPLLNILENAEIGNCISTVAATFIANKFFIDIVEIAFTEEGKIVLRNGSVFRSGNKINSKGDLITVNEIIMENNNNDDNTFLVRT